jgi:transposase
MLPKSIEGNSNAPKCGLVYNRDLNACINIARRLMRSADGELGF